MTMSRLIATAAACAALGVVAAGAQDRTRDSRDDATSTAMSEAYALAGAADDLSEELNRVMLVSMADVDEEIAAIAAELRAAADAKDVKATQDAANTLSSTLMRLQRAAPESVELQAKTGTISRIFSSVTDLQRALQDADRARADEAED